MLAKDLEIIQTDIEIARNLLYPSKNGDAYVSTSALNMAAYHSTQAIEKGLKAIIRDNEEGADKNSLLTHGIERLLVRAEMCSPNFISNHKFIAENAVSLSMLNTARYGDKIVGKKDVYVLFKEARGFVHELQKEYEKNKLKGNLKEEARQQYGESERISLKTNNSQYSRD